MYIFNPVYEKRYYSTFITLNLFIVYPFAMNPSQNKEGAYESQE